MTRRDFVAMTSANSLLPVAAVELLAIAGPRLPEVLRVRLAAPAGTRVFERRRIGGSVEWLYFDSLAAREAKWDEVAARGGAAGLGEFTLYCRKGDVCES